MDERQQVTIIARAIQTLEWLRDNPGSLRDETSIGSCMAAESWRELRELEVALTAQFGIAPRTIDHGQHEFPTPRGASVVARTGHDDMPGAAEDAALIVAAVNALAPLLDAHEALQRRVAELEGDR